MLSKGTKVNLPDAADGDAGSDIFFWGCSADVVDHTVYLRSPESPHEIYINLELDDSSVEDLNGKESNIAEFLKYLLAEGWVSEKDRMKSV